MSQTYKARGPEVLAWINADKILFSGNNDIILGDNNESQGKNFASDIIVTHGKYLLGDIIFSTNHINQILSKKFALMPPVEKKGSKGNKSTLAKRKKSKGT